MLDVFVLNALPFLPRGKGASILILGGMAVLAVSLLWSLLALRTTRPIAALTRAARAPVRGRPMPVAVQQAQQQAQANPSHWLGTLLATAVRAGLGYPEILRSDSTRYILRLADCRSCRGRRGGSGCERERATMERVMRAFAPMAKVTETSCNTSRQGACTFQLTPGADVL